MSAPAPVRPGIGVDPRATSHSRAEVHDWPISSARKSAAVADKEKIVAAHRAADTFPRAIDVKAIDDWTVEGSTDRRINPV